MEKYIQNSKFKTSLQIKKFVIHKIRSKKKSKNILKKKIFVMYNQPYLKIFSSFYIKIGTPTFNWKRLK